MTGAPGCGSARCSSVAAAVVTTSGWSRRRLLELYALPGERVHVAEPAVDAAGLASGTAAGGALLCVAAVTFDKGHDVLLDALAATADLAWRLRVRGQPGPGPGVRRASAPALAGPAGWAIASPSPDPGPEPIWIAATPRADLMVLASRAETFGMVVPEALARGLPVVAAEVGGLPEALGHGADGIRPGLLVAAGRRGGPRRRAPGVARRRRAERTAAPGRPGAAHVASGLVETASVVAAVLAGVSR